MNIDYNFWDFVAETINYDKERHKIYVGEMAS